VHNEEQMIQQCHSCESTQKKTFITQFACKYAQKYTSESNPEVHEVKTDTQDVASNVY
jgi:hypothetical protein